MEVIAPAKINLVLRVGPRRADGFHAVSTVLAALELGDRLQIATARSTTVRAPTLPGGDTLVTRAIGLLVERSGHAGGFTIEIEKRVPAGAGLGGGSADAGVALRVANTLLARPLADRELLEVAAAVGSDVPFFAAGWDAARAAGRGEVLEEAVLPRQVPRFVVVAWPGLALATADVYGAFEQPDSLRPALLADLGANDLGVAAEALCPASAALRVALERAGAVVASVSGSGSAVYGLFHDEAHATRGLSAVRSAPWSAVTRLADRGTMQT